MMSDSLVARMMFRFKRELQQREQAQMQEMTQRWLDLERIVRPQMESLAAQLNEQRRNGQPITQSQLFRLERYQTLLRVINGQWNAYRDYAVDTITQAQFDYGLGGIQHAIASLETQIGEATAVAFTRLPVETIESAVGLVGNGSPLADWLMRNVVRAQAVDEMTATLLESVALGWNPRKTARAMQDKLAGGLNQALNTARTEQMRIYRTSNRQQMAASGVVNGYYRIATRDSRTCMACLARDGEFIPLDQEMAEHNQGRCAQVPAVVGVAKPEWQTGSEWFLTRSAEQQEAQLGRARYEAWRRGDFDISDLARIDRNATWGDALRPVPLKDLI